MSQLAVSATRHVTPVYGARRIEEVLSIVEVQHGIACGGRAAVGIHTVIRRDSPSAALAISIGFRRVRLSFCHRVSRYTSDYSANRSPTLSTAQRYLLAILITLAALLLRVIMAPLWETTAPFALFMFATVIAAWFAGIGPAIFTGAVGFATRLYFDSPRGPGNCRSPGKKPCA